MDHMGFTVYGNSTVTAKIWERYPEWPLEVNTTRSFCSFTHANYLVTPVRAKHGGCEEDAHNLLIERGGKTFFYATDTGIWPDETWFRLRDFHVDAMVIECTNGFVPTDYDGHLSIEQCIGVVDRLRSKERWERSRRSLPPTTATEATPPMMSWKRFEPPRHRAGYDGMVFEVLMRLFHTLHRL